MADLGDVKGSICTVTQDPKILAKIHLALLDAGLSTSASFLAIAEMQKARIIFTEVE